VTEQVVLLLTTICNHTLSSICGHEQL